MTALRHPKILTYFHIRSATKLGGGAPARLVLAPLVTLFSILQKVGARDQRA